MNDSELIRSITGECTPEGRENIKEWLEQSSQNREKFKELYQTWALFKDLDLNSDEDEDEAWRKLSSRISESNDGVTIYHLNNGFKNRIQSQSVNKGTFLNRKKHFRTWIYSIAAACILVLFVSVMFYSYNYSGSEYKSSMKEVIAKQGERMYLTLDDGTSIVLNSLSKLRYPARFKGQRREVELEGEAFFSVARNEKKPFLVHTNKATIRVLGTKFNINAYDDFNRVEVVVKDGTVAVKSGNKGILKPNPSSKHKSDADKVVLHKGEYTMVREGSTPTQPVKVNLDHYLGWINGDLIFDATPLNIVIRRLELYYNRDFKVSNKSLLNRKITASFKKESLSKVLDVLSIVLDIKYDQHDSVIYLKPHQGYSKKDNK